MEKGEDEGPDVVVVDEEHLNCGAAKAIMKDDSRNFGPVGNVASVWRPGDTDDDSGVLPDSDCCRRFPLVLVSGGSHDA